MSLTELQHPKTKQKHLGRLDSRYVLVAYFKNPYEQHNYSQRLRDYRFSFYSHKNEPDWNEPLPLTCVERAKNLLKKLMKKGTLKSASFYLNLNLGGLVNSHLCACVEPPVLIRPNPKRRHVYKSNKKGFAPVENCLLWKFHPTEGYQLQTDQSLHLRFPKYNSEQKLSLINAQRYHTQLQADFQMLISPEQATSLCHYHARLDMDIF